LADFHVPSAARVAIGEMLGDGRIECLATALGAVAIEQTVVGEVEYASDHR
jgi:hypothetical protein